MKANWLNDGADRVFPLGQPLHPNVPHFRGHPPFLYSLTRFHGDPMRPGGASGAGDFIATDTHLGTHIDSIYHVSKHMKLYGDVDAAGVQSAGDGIRVPGAANLPPVVGRGLLLDIAALRETERLPDDFAITSDVVEEALARDHLELRSGDVVLFRTGWDALWSDPSQFVSAALPGPDLSAAQLLARHHIRATGSDTSPYELFPNPDLAVHVELLVRSGIPIMENLNLQDLAREGIREFQFVAAPLNIMGATGSPISPLAIVPASHN